MMLLDLLYEGFVVGLVVGSIIGLFYFKLTNKPKITSMQSARDLMLNQFCPTGLLCKKCYLNWFAEYNTRKQQKLEKVE